MTTATVCVFGWVVFVVTWTIGVALAFLDGDHPRRANGAPRWGNPGLEIIAGILSGVGALGACSCL